MTTHEILVNAKLASRTPLDTDTKNAALEAMACALRRNCAQILAANAIDLQNAEGKISPVMMDRLKLDEKRIDGMAQGIRDAIALPDPSGKILEETQRPNGLRIQKVSVPFGVVAVIYESRPNVTSAAAALLLKSGNACVLRGGKEAVHSNTTIVKALREGLQSVGINENYVSILEDTSREGAKELMTANGLVDLLIPRGGAGLIAACVRDSTVPVIQTGTGICHIYVDAAADLDMALNIIENAKMSRPSVCNAAEVCLVHRDIADRFLPMLYKRMQEDRAAKGLPVCEFREGEFDTEFLGYTMGIGIVDDVKAAVAHIAEHSTHHSESIITRDEAAADYFTAMVDSAAVYVNASTRFTDGGEFGFGCEIGISTQKLHARGPMGLREMNTYKYVIRGNGQTR